MIYGHGFNIIHMPKTGGTWLRRVCERLPRGCKIVSEMYPHHLPARKLTDAEAALPTYVLVRNPWDWYVSLYGHWHGNIVNKRHEFRHPVNRLSEYWRGVHERFGGTFERAMRPYLGREAPRDPHTGHRFQSMTDTFQKFVARDDGVDLRVRKFEDGPRRIFTEILQEHCPQLITPEVTRLIETHQQENVSGRRRDFRSYYTPKLRELVAELDAELIEEYGYQFEA